MKYKIIYFDRWAEGWYPVNLRFNTEQDAKNFLDNPRHWPKEIDSRALSRAVHDSSIQILKQELVNQK